MRYMLNDLKYNLLNYFYCWNFLLKSFLLLLQNLYRQSSLTRGNLKI